MSVQLQPQPGQSEEWIAFARSRDYRLELIEFSMAMALSAPQQSEGLLLRYRECGLVSAIHGVFMDVNPASGDPGIRELSRKRCYESCETALALGAKYVVFHSSAFPFLRGGYLENWADVCGRFYEELAEKYPLTICIENAQDLDPEPLSMLMSRVASPRIGVCLDIGHANYTSTGLADWFSSLAGKIRYLHLSDNLGCFDDHLVLGEGNIPWQEADRYWRTLEEDVPVTLETGCLASTRRSLAYLAQNACFGVR